MIYSCAGSEKIKRPYPQDLNCRSCGAEIEIWTDEIEAACAECGHIFRRTQEACCLDWCRYAKECVGGYRYAMYIRNKNVTIKEKLLKSLEDHFGSDTKRINHAKKVTHFAEELLKGEKADRHIVIPASILHDVGIKIAEQKYGSSAGHYQEKEGPPAARAILAETGLRKEDIDQICDIIAHHHSPGKIDTLNFEVLYEADWLVNLKDEVDLKDRNKLKKTIEKVFKTGTGKRLAAELYLAEEKPEQDT